jgi:hypothetical protein
MCSYAAISIAGANAKVVKYIADGSFLTVNWSSF